MITEVYCHFYLEPLSDTVTAVDTNETVFETSYEEAARVNSSPKSTILNNKNWFNDMKASFNVITKNVWIMFVICIYIS